MTPEKKIIDLNHKLELKSSEADVYKKGFEECSDEKTSGLYQDPSVVALEMSLAFILGAAVKSLVDRH